MQIVFMYIQNHYIKNYMLLHKLNQAKNTSYQFFFKKKLCTFSIFKSIKPIYKPQIVHRHRLVHKLLTLEHSDKQMSLWLV